MNEDAIENTPDPALAVEQNPPPPVVDNAPPPPPEPVEDKQPHGNVGKEPWFTKRINDLETNAQQERAAREQAERDLQNTRAMLEQMQRGEQRVNNAPNENLRQPAPAPFDDQRVRQEAEKLRFLEDVNDVRARGFSQFGPAFNGAISTLGAAGAASDAFVADVLAVDKTNAHVLLDTLAKDPERAAALAQMNSRQRIAELTRMTMAKPAASTSGSQPQKTNISRAPAPPPPVNPGGKKATDWRADDSSEDEFTQGFTEMMKSRAGHR